MRRVLTDARLAGLRPLAHPYNVCDTRVPGLIVRVGKSSASDAGRTAMNIRNIIRARALKGERVVWSY